MHWLKIIHISCVVLSFCGFFMRGVWMFSNPVMLQKKWVKVLPHVVDTGLLLSAISMLYVFQWSVLDHSWIQLKIGLLVVYIWLGMVALKPARPVKVRVVAWFSGLFVFLFIVFVAVTKFGF